MNMQNTDLNHLPTHDEQPTTEEQLHQQVQQGVTQQEVSVPDQEINQGTEVLASGQNEPESPNDDKKKLQKKKGKRAGRRKIKIEFIQDKSRRHITFSKRKGGIMKKAYELSTLTGTQVLLLIASETGHVYTFATPKLQPLITKTEGKNLIQACLNAPDNPEEEVMHRPDDDDPSRLKTEMKQSPYSPTMPTSQQISLSQDYRQGFNVRGLGQQPSMQQGYPGYGMPSMQSMGQQYSQGFGQNLGPLNMNMQTNMNAPKLGHMGTHNVGLHTQSGSGMSPGSMSPLSHQFMHGGRGPNLGPQ
jgi:hypothetical protein